MNDSFHLTPERASNLAGPYDLLFYSLCGMSFVITVGIALAILIFVVKYRRRHANEFGKDIGSHPSLEITWTVIPLLVCLGIFVWSSIQYIGMSRAPANALVIQVIGKQWMWKIQHPSGRKEINELHVPLGQPVKLQMTSEDVIHSFFIPAFRIKQDVLPGRYSEEWFIPTTLGEYHLFCAEYCGNSHSRMIGKVVVMNPGEYQAWVANAAPENRPEVAGAKLFSDYGCIACHGQQAPTLAGIYNHEQILEDGRHIKVDDDYLRESILNPRAKIVAGFTPTMPSFQGQLSEEQVFQLIAYIKSIEVPGGPPPTPVPLSPGQTAQPGASTP
jgi:cytochrome c oxidase subunit 2